MAFNQASAAQQPRHNTAAKGRGPAAALGQFRGQASTSQQLAVMLGTPRGDVGRIEAFGDEGGPISPVAMVHGLGGAGLRLGQARPRQAVQG